MCMCVRACVCVRVCVVYVGCKLSHDMTKPTKWVWAQRRLRSAQASAQSDQTSLSARKKAWVLSYPLNAQRRLWSDWADVQADPSLRWPHTHFVGSVMSWLNYVLLLKSTCTQNLIEFLQFVYIVLRMDALKWAMSWDYGTFRPP